LGLEQAFSLNQIHGNQVYHPQELPAEGDGLWTDNPQQSVWVASADCVPILIAGSGVVAAVHAGWRGTAAKILPTLLQRLALQGSDLTTLRIAIGPAISPARYPVGLEVAQAVLTTIEVTPTSLVLDLKAVNYQQALSFGLKPEQVSISPHCTYENPQFFYSYRRDGRTGVQWSGISPT
jgi:YfiH family protein